MYKTYRIVWLEETFKDNLVQLFDLYRANQTLKHVTDSTVQMLLEHWQASGISHLYRKPVPVFDDPHSKDIFQI